ncbi:uncharacterized protein SCHCODRAFT_02578855 [Schizophyllum commune H4-8]|uniref:uncharacterized protein n=1 Tax=Schizophyllum commune (strain H4-8 / FGSC 9210) TaxID=578458 RepID=UPI00216056D6|nr:uncharacterized protein SCHCODRAFT_02578855 [Schizophyllum commune H4-8]KAI5892504.1 hypothetical protein SCHCODRAFT_02578855 [Schizophyllum commune H4-8]
MTSNPLDSTLPTTPSHEWAQVTAAELAQQQAKVDHQATLAAAKTTGPTTVSTTTTRSVSPPGSPGPDIPGAYPGSDPEDAKPEETLAAAATYLPARKDVEQTLADATRVAKQYLPEQVAGLIPDPAATKYPTQEGTNEALGTTGGAGALPGARGEEGVARLPEERTRADGAPVPTTINTADRAFNSQPPVIPASNTWSASTTSPIASTTTGVQSTLGQAADAVKPAASQAQETLGQAKDAAVPAVQSTLGQAADLARQYLPASVASYLPGAVVADLPSKEGPNERLGTTDGVGALPGSSSEASVAKLPDERSEVIHAPHSTIHHITPIGSLAGEGLGASMSADLQGREHDKPQGDDKPPVVTTTNAISHAKENVAHPTPSNTASFAPVPAAGIARAEHPADNISLQANDGSAPSSPGAGTPSTTTAAMVPLPADSVKNVPGTTADMTSTGKTSTQGLSGSHQPAHSIGRDASSIPGVPSKDKPSDASSKLEPLRRAEGDAASNASVLSGKMPGHSRIPPPEPPAKDAQYAGAGSASAHSSQDSSTSTQDSTKDSASHPHRTSVPLTTAAERMSSKSRHGEEQLADNGARLPSSAPHEAEKAKGSTTEGHVKVSTMDKIRGEAKIISGKFSNKEEKVEEGRKLMGKV